MKGADAEHGLSFGSERDAYAHIATWAGGCLGACPGGLQEHNRGMAVELEELLLPDAAAWRSWLEANHSTSPGVWLVLHKKGGNVTELDYAAALDEALCFGWIDGQTRRRDEHASLQRMTPRTRRSPWSARNVGHVARLDAAGKMTDAGWRPAQRS